MTKTKRQPTKSEKTFVNAVSDKGLISKIYEKLTKLNTQRTKNAVKKLAKDMSRHFSKEDLQMDNMKKMLNIPLASEKLKKKLERETTSHCSEWLRLTPQKMTDIGEDVKKEEPSRRRGKVVEE